MNQVQWYENLFYQSNLGFDGKIYKGMEKVLRFCVVCFRLLGEWINPQSKKWDRTVLLQNAVTSQALSVQ